MHLQVIAGVIMHIVFLRQTWMCMRRVSMQVNAEQFPRLNLYFVLLPIANLDTFACAVLLPFSGQ